MDVAATMYYNGDILTMEGDTPVYVEALVVRADTIAFAGSRDAAMAVAGKGHRMVDLAGRTLLPGFIDAHSHLTKYADGLRQADLSPPPIGQVEDMAGILQALQALKERLGAADTTWLVGFGYDQDMLAERRHPTAADLDAAFPSNPVLLFHTSSHMLVANSAAMRRAGITADTPDPPGGTFVRKKGTREPEGLVQEMAMMPLYPFAVEALPLDKEFEKLDQAQRHYASFGITTAAEHLLLEPKMTLLDSAAAQGKLFIDLVATPGFVMADEVIGSPRIRWGEYQGRLKYGGLKLALDGSPQGKTAFLRDPYLTDVPGCTHDCRGFPNMTQEEVNALMERCYREGIQVYAHCNGDASIDMMFEGHRNAVRAVGDSTADRRTVIIHSQVMRPDQLDLYKTFGLLPSFFTNHTYYWGDVHLANLGATRAGFISPMRSAIDKGILCTNHTDCTVTPIDPLFLLWTSVNRISRSGQVIGAQERITPYEGLRAMTTHAAYQYFEADEKGTLTPGKQADIVILDRNPLRVDPGIINEIKVMATVKGGRTIYTRS